MSSQEPRRSLVTRLVLYMVVLSPLAAIMLGTVAFLSAREALREAVVARLDLAANLKAEALERWTEDQRRDFLLLDSLPLVQSLGHLLIDPATPEDERATAQRSLAGLFRLLVDRKPAWRELSILSPRGKILLSTEPSNEGDYRVLDRYFVEGRNAPFLQKVYPSPRDFTPTMTLSAPVSSTLGQPAVLALHLDLLEMDQILFSSTGLEASSETYLVDSFNVFVSGRRIGREEYPRGVHSLGIDAALSGDRGTGLYDNYHGQPVIGAWRWVEGLGVAQLVEIPQQVAFAPARQLARQLLGHGLATTFLLSVGIFLLARQIVRPIDAITRSALAVSEGDLDNRAPIFRDDEVGLLAKTFNRMVGDLKAKNDELERFTYTVSHDLKSPLVTIRGFLGLLDRDVASGDIDRARHDIDRIRNATETMAHLLDDLLALSRVGRVAQTLHPIALDRVVGQVAALLTGPLEERGVELVVQDDLPQVLGDSTRLLEVFQNLIENAIKFMGQQAHPRIEVGARNEGEMVHCHVRDNGIGIDAVHHEAIFGLFDRVDSQVEGSGLGLTLVRRIVEAHGGAIHVESAGRGQGSCFYFTLPSIRIGHHLGTRSSSQ